MLLPLKNLKIRFYGSSERSDLRTPAAVAQFNESYPYLVTVSQKLEHKIQLDADGGFPKLKSKSVSKISSTMSENDLCVIYRIRNPETKRFTSRRKTPFEQRRLHHFVISDCPQEAVQTIEIIPSVQSDPFRSNFDLLHHSERGKRSRLLEIQQLIDTGQRVCSSDEKCNTKFFGKCLILG